MCARPFLLPLFQESVINNRFVEIIESVPERFINIWSHKMDCDLFSNIRSRICKPKFRHKTNTHTHTHTSVSLFRSIVVDQCHLRTHSCSKYISYSVNAALTITSWSQYTEIGLFLSPQPSPFLCACSHNHCWGWELETKNKRQPGCGFEDICQIFKVCYWGVTKIMCTV